jgi:hypothetical protein
MRRGEDDEDITLDATATHPLFPGKSDKDPPLVEFIHVVRDGAMGPTYSHRRYEPHELQSLSDLQEQFGGGSYELISYARGKISSRIRYRLDGEPKPMNGSMPKAEDPTRVAALNAVQQIAQSTAQRANGLGSDSGLLATILQMQMQSQQQMLQMQQASQQQMMQMFVTLTTAMTQGQQQQATDMLGREQARNELFMKAMMSNNNQVTPEHIRQWIELGRESVVVDDAEEDANDLLNAATTLLAGIGEGKEASASAGGGNSSGAAGGSN